MNSDEKSAAAKPWPPRGVDRLMAMLAAARVNGVPSTHDKNAPSRSLALPRFAEEGITAEEGIPAEAGSPAGAATPAMAAATPAVANVNLTVGSYRPRPLQRELHGDAARFKVIVAHRRFGKTVFAINELLRAAWRARLPAARLAYVAPYERQAKAVAWDQLKHHAGAIRGARFHETELRCDLPWGARVSLYGADNPDALRGLYLDGAVLDEYAQMEPRAWSEVIRPALADRQGWAIFIGTPMGRNSLWSLFERAKRLPGWRAQLFRASQTGVLPQAELEAARAAMSEAEYAQEF